MATNGGKKWYNNGTTNIMCLPGEEPEGYVVGKLQKLARTTLKGKSPYHNEEGEIKYFGAEETIPEGFIRGVTPELREHLKSIAGNNLGKSKSDETKKKLSDAAKLRLSNPENHGMYGKHHSEEAKKKMSEARLGRPCWNAGKHYTKEQKAKVIQSHIDRYGSIEEWKRISTEKNKQTKLERYGDPHYTNPRKARTTYLSTPNAERMRQEKIKQTKIEKYGSLKVASKHKEQTMISNSQFETKEEYYKNWRLKLYNKHPNKGSKLEKRCEEFLKNNNLIYSREYLCSNELYKHSFDFAVYMNDELVMLIDCDGMYYHGYYSDTDGYHVNSYSDDYRSQLVPYGVKFLVIVEGHEEAGYKELLSLLSIDYDEYIQSIYNWCRDVGFPYPAYSEDVLSTSWQSLNKSDVVNRFSPRSRFGEKLILHFHPSIWEGSKSGKPSPVEAWNNDELLLKAIKNRIIYKGNSLDPSRVLSGLWVSGIAPRVSIFNPNLAKYLVEKYLKTYDTVFDPCSGFSGRMLGVTSLGKNYIGQDINITTILESNKLIQFLNIGESVQLNNVDSLKESGKYDCLFTCPPYGNKERWKDSSNYLSTDEWITCILNNYDCKSYLFVVDDTRLYKDYIVEEISNRSHFGSNTEYVLLIKK